METETANNFKELNDKLINYVTNLQNLCKDLEEDTILNATHIKELKLKFEKSYNGINDELRQTNKNCDEFSQELESKFNENEFGNYATFLKELLKNDLVAIQNNFIEDINRKIESKISNKKGINFISALSLIFSVSSFVFLILLNIKFDLFSQIFK